VRRSTRVPLSEANEPRTAPKQPVQLPALTVDLGNSLGATGRKRNNWFGDESDDSEDDEVTRVIESGHAVADSDSEDDEPIAAVVQKRLTLADPSIVRAVRSPTRATKVSQPKRLSLAFHGTSTLDFGLDDAGSDVSSSDDEPLVHRLSAQHPSRGSDDDDRPLGEDDDMPLGQVHPEAAHAYAFAQQQQQYLWAAAQQQQAAYYYAYAAAAYAQNVGGPGSVLSGAASGPPGELADLGHPMPAMPPNPALVNHVAQWVSAVPIGAASATSSRS
jgi:hypothetical protein